MDKYYCVDHWLDFKLGNLLFACFHYVLGLVRRILLEASHHVIARMHKNNFLEDHGISRIQNYIDNGTLVSNNVDFFILIHLLKDESFLKNGLGKEVDSTCNVYRCVITNLLDGLVQGATRTIDLIHHK